MPPVCPGRFSLHGPKRRMPSAISPPAANDLRPYLSSQRIECQANDSGTLTVVKVGRFCPWQIVQPVTSIGTYSLDQPAGRRRSRSKTVRSEKVCYTSSNVSAAGDAVGWSPHRGTSRVRTIRCRSPRFLHRGDRPFAPVYKIVGKANACQLPASNETWLSNGLPADKIVRQLIDCVGSTGVHQAPDHPVA